MTDTTDIAAAWPNRRRRPALIAAAAALLAVVGGAGALAIEATRPSVTMAPATPIAIRALTPGSIATVRGRVAEVYGNKFILADPSGRALIETGRAGEDGTLVTVGQPVTVQGRFARGFVHAAFLVGADGTVRALAPLDGPPGGHHPHGPDGHDGPGGPGGPDGLDRDGPDAPRPAAPAAAAGPRAAPGA